MSYQDAFRTDRSLIGVMVNADETSDCVEYVWSMIIENKFVFIRKLALECHIIDIVSDYMMIIAFNKSVLL